MTSQTETKSDCCPEFDPIPWDDKTFEWENKKFIKDKVCTLFYMPVNVDKEVPGAENVVLSGKFYSKVYEGPFKNTGKWCKDFGTIAKSKGLNCKKMYLWYTTCPKCAKKYGKNYVVIMSPVE